MTSTRKVRLQDRGAPEPKPSRKVVLDELLRSLQDLVTHELAVEVPLDESPRPAATPAAAPPPRPAATETPSPARTGSPVAEPTTAAASEPESQDPTVEELVAMPVASPAEIAAHTAPGSEPAAAVEREAATPAGNTKPLELAVESGPITRAPERQATAPKAKPAAPKPAPKSVRQELALDPRPAATAPDRKPTASKSKSRPLELAIEPRDAAPPREPAAPARASDRHDAAPPRRSRLGDTVVLTPPRDLPPPPAIAAPQGGRPSTVETPVPPGGLQQQLPYLDVSPSAGGPAADGGRRPEPDKARPESSKPARTAPAAKDDPHPDRGLLTEPDIEIPDLPAAAAIPHPPTAHGPMDRASAMASDGPGELPDLDYSAVPAAPPSSAPAALSIADDNTGPSDIPLLEDAIDLDEYIELSAESLPRPSTTAAAGATAADPRRLAIQLAARLNVELRREGKPVLGSDVIARLARMLEESLAKGAPNMENTRPKKP